MISQESPEAIEEVIHHNIMFTRLSFPLRPTEDETPSAPALMPRVTVIKAYSKGFACSAGPGTVCLFEKTEEKNNYRQIREIRIPPDPCSNEPGQAEQQEITSMCISPTEETLAISTDRGQIYLIALASAEISKGMQAQFEFLSHSFHSGIITGLSACIRKPLVATCSMDHSIRIWNYETGVLELYKEFQEESYSVALHPSGLFVLAGFSDKLRLMNLLIDDIRTFKEFTVRCCRECVFSHGGHMFAAVNGNVIHLYSTTTFDNILNLKGHSGKVRSVVWSSDDSRVVSCGMDGAVYEWNALSGQRESESVLKSCSYTSVAFSHNTRSTLAVGNDHTLKEIQDYQVLREVASDDVIYTAIVMTHSGRALFTGTSSGTIRAIKYPLLLQKDWTEYQAHSAPITKVRDVEAVLHRLKTDLHHCVGFIQEPKKLKESIREIYERYVHQSDVVEIAGVDAEVQREYSRQRDHMERNMDSLRKRLAKDIKVHEAKNIKLMKENVSLIKDINNLRTELRLMRAQIHDYETQNGFNKHKSATYIKCESQSFPAAASLGASRLNIEGEAEHIIQQQRLEIQRLRQEILGQGQGQGQDQSFVLPRLSSNIKLPALST
ncbi:cilia- and flagella-associated protein 57 isoform X1 [Tachysurus ichikawai]